MGQTLAAGTPRRRDPAGRPLGDSRFTTRLVSPRPSATAGCTPATSAICRTAALRLRPKDLIIVNGCKYHPQDLEWAVDDLAGVRKGRVVAFGLAEQGRADRVVIVAEASGTAPPDAIVEAIRKRIGDLFGLYVDDVAVVTGGTVGRTTSGKVQRGAEADVERGALRIRLHTPCQKAARRRQQTSTTFRIRAETRHLSQSGHQRHRRCSPFARRNSADASNESRHTNHRGARHCCGADVCDCSDDQSSGSAESRGRAVERRARLVEQGPQRAGAERRRVQKALGSEDALHRAREGGEHGVAWWKTHTRKSIGWPASCSRAAGTGGTPVGTSGREVRHRTRVSIQRSPRTCRNFDRT